MGTAEALRVGRAENAALELFRLAALLLGSEEEAVGAVEETVHRFRPDPCATPEAMRSQARRLLTECSLARALAHGWPLAPPAAAAQPEPSECIPTDDLDAAGLSPERIAELMSGAGRERMRDWLDGLPHAERLVFVLRAIMGQRADETAEMLRGAGAGDWTPAAVSQVFRQALCSLASSLARTVAPAA